MLCISFSLGCYDSLQHLQIPRPPVDQEDGHKIGDVVRCLAIKSVFERLPI